jgi:Flp pilus assembly protein TadD
MSSGNIYFSNIANGDVETAVKKSLSCYHSVLRDDPRNVYAANGLAMVCVEKGRGDIAKDILSRVC